MEVIYNIRSRRICRVFVTTLHLNRGGVIEQCSILRPRDEIHPSSRVDTSAVTDVAVTPAAKTFNDIVRCNTFEGVAVNYRCAVRLFTFALSGYLPPRSCWVV